MLVISENIFEKLRPPGFSIILHICRFLNFPLRTVIPTYKEGLLVIVLDPVIEAILSPNEKPSHALKVPGINEIFTFIFTSSFI